MRKDLLNDIEKENRDIANLIAESSSKIKVPDTHMPLDEILNHSAYKKEKRRHKSYRRTHKSEIHRYRKSTVTIALTAACFAIILISFGAYQNISSEHPQPATIHSDSLMSQKNMRTASTYQQIYQVFQKSFRTNQAFKEDFGTVNTCNTAFSEDGINTNDSDTTKSFSDTNEQTEGVHEADIIKTDGNYIYTLKPTWDKNLILEGYRLYISEAQGTKVRHLSHIDFQQTRSKKNKQICDYYNEMYYYNNKLILIDCRTVETLKKKDSESYKYENFTLIYIYDISDRSNPKLISKNQQEGRYISSRMSDNYLYTVTSKQLHSMTYKELIPKVNGKAISCDCIYLPETIDTPGFSIITSLDVNNSSQYLHSLSVAGNSDFIYTSAENIYILNNYTDIKDVSQSTDFKKTLKKKYQEPQTGLKKLTDKAFLDYIKECSPKSDISKVYQSEEYYSYVYTSMLNIIKYTFHEGAINYIGSSNVKGLANQNLFFDEKDGYLRFVCSYNAYTETGLKTNYYDKNKKLISEEIFSLNSLKEKYEDISTSLFVLDKNLSITASINGIAKGESLYSARYLGDFGYFVTFEQIDPLFSVDFSDMKHPKIIGALKIPGNSNYLHFYSDSLLLGIGNETIKNSDYLKLEMYTLKNGSAKQKSKLLLKDCSSFTDNYKGILVAPEKNLIGFAVTQTMNTDIYNNDYVLYTYKNNKLKQFAKIRLGTESDSDVRGFYIDNYFYVVDTENGIYSFNLETYSKNHTVTHTAFDN